MIWLKPTSTDYDEDGFKTAIYFEKEAVHHIPYYGKFVPTGTEQMGALYVLRPGADDAVRSFSATASPSTDSRRTVEVTDFEWFKIVPLVRRISSTMGII